MFRNQITNIKKFGQKCNHEIFLGYTQHFILSYASILHAYHARHINYVTNYRGQIPLNNKNKTFLLNRIVFQLIKRHEIEFLNILTKHWRQYKFKKVNFKITFILSSLFLSFSLSFFFSLRPPSTLLPPTTTATFLHLPSLASPSLWPPTTPTLAAHYFFLLSPPFR